jgi:hypothetical protein
MCVSLRGDLPICPPGILLVIMRMQERLKRLLPERLCALRASFLGRDANQLLMCVGRSKALVVCMSF